MTRQYTYYLMIARTEMFLRVRVYRNCAILAMQTRCARLRNDYFRHCSDRIEMAKDYLLCNNGREKGNKSNCFMNL